MNGNMIIKFAPQRLKTVISEEIIKKLCLILLGYRRLKLSKITGAASIFNYTKICLWVSCLWVSEMSVAFAYASAKEKIM